MKLKEILRLYGIRSILRWTARRIHWAFLKKRAGSGSKLPGLNDLRPIYRYATCDDLITLKAKHPQFCLNGVPDRQSFLARGWG
jgi:hypothetical protein